MPRAYRSYIPNQIWHITHRCHDKNPLLRLKQDRRNWVDWLYQAKMRFGLYVLNYTIMHNHIHLLVYDNEAGVIPSSMQLIAGKTAQEYNRRHRRKGSFWEDRYHATAVASETHLFRCIVYIDLNAVRAGLVTHPSKWHSSGYAELQQPQGRRIIIARAILLQLLGYASVYEFRSHHRNMIQERINSGLLYREPGWTEGVAYGTKAYIQEVKAKLLLRSGNRRFREIQDGADWLIREANVNYGDN